MNTTKWCSQVLNLHLWTRVQRTDTASPNCQGNLVKCFICHHSIQRGRGREAIRQVTSCYSDLSTLNMKLKTYLCILIDWSWCPFRAIMTSASSNTNILIFFGSRTLCLKIQSRRVPGVPNIMWSVTFWPLETVKKRMVLLLM